MDYSKYALIRALKSLDITHSPPRVPVSVGSQTLGRGVGQPGREALE
jgi:hypothetical protein